MLRIRLRRVGRKKQPSYRIVVAERSMPRDGRFVEIIGFYNPRTEPETVKIQEERALYWLSVGAQPSDAVQRLFDKYGVTERFAATKQPATEESVAEVEAEPESAVEVPPEETPEVETPAEEPSAEQTPEASA